MFVFSFEPPKNAMGVIFLLYSEETEAENTEGLPKETFVSVWETARD